MLCFGRAGAMLVLIVLSTSFRLWVSAEEMLAYVEGSACEVNENVLFPREEEVTGLDLLQVDLRLQSNSVVSAISSTPSGEKHEKAEAVESKPASMAKAAKSYDIVAVDGEGDIESRSTQPSPASLPNTMLATSVSSASASVEFPLELREEFAHNEVHHRSTTQFLMRMKRFIASLTQTSRIGFVAVVILLVVTCSVVLSLVVIAQRPKPPTLQQDTYLLAAKGEDFPGQSPQSPSPAYEPYASRIDSRQRTSFTNPTYTSPPQASIAPVVVSSNSSSTMLVPPICPALILSSTEARFMIPLDSLNGTSLDILGTSGRKLLHCETNVTDEGRQRLTIASTGMENHPNAIVLEPPRGDPCGAFEILGKGGAFYGTMVPASGGGFMLQCQGRNVMSIESSGSDLRMTAHSMAGSLLASADKQSGQEVWSIRIKPNNDAVLISACMLAPLLLTR